MVLAGFKLATFKLAPLMLGCDLHYSDPHLSVHSPCLLVAVTSMDLKALASIHAGIRTKLRSRNIHPMKRRPTAWVTVTRYHGQLLYGQNAKDLIKSEKLYKLQFLV